MEIRVLDLPSHCTMQSSPEEAAPLAVIVPARDRRELLAECLEQLRSQDYPSDRFEIVVCDDGSREDISAAVARPQPGTAPVRIVRQPPRGPAAAKNLGIRSTTAPILVFVDSDVIPESGFLRNLASALAAHPEWAGAEAALIPSGGGEGPLWDAPRSEGGRYHSAAIAFRRCALLQAGGFDENFRLPACEDVELAARILYESPIGFVAAARARHPRRRIGAAAHWRWRHHWRYELILALRHGILSFPGRQAGSSPRMRLAIAAAVALPAARMMAGLRHLDRSVSEGLLACLYSLLDVLAGLSSLPQILFGTVPPRMPGLPSPPDPRSKGE